MHKVDRREREAEREIKLLKEEEIVEEISARIDEVKVLEKDAA